ncbi:hypothetical protein SDC9_92114 [bioreactor metagenome]|uniref:Uncharacterized protein n=1 Tax=bioreactor metagenome TaxID=1076179 RepID=A0A644ZXF0_9ZZZZ
MGEERDSKQTDEEHEKCDDKHADHKCVGNICMIDEQSLSGNQTMNGQCPEHDGGGCRTRDSQ